MGRPKKRPESWTGQIGMDVGEQRKRVEPESSVQKRVTDALEAVGVLVERHNIGGFKKGRHFVRFGKKGDPDLRCLMWPGIVFFVETKRGKGGIITEEQHARVAELRRLGFVAGFASSPEEALALWTEAKKARAA